MASGGTDAVNGTSSDVAGYVLDRPTQKTAISFLQEICTRKGMAPTYELLSTEGQVHEPTFLYRVTVSDLSATGQGKSKKQAKHMAAKGLLERIVAVGRNKEFSIPGDTAADANAYVQKLLIDVGVGTSSPSSAVVPVAAAGEPSTVNADDGDGVGGDNPVGRLQEMCQQKRWPPPIYEVTKEDGMPHDRIFILEITMGNFKVEGVGRSKKVAKRNAAEKMLKFLEKLPSEEQTAGIGILEEDELAETGSGQAVVQQPFADLDEPLSKLALRDEAFVVKTSDRRAWKDLMETDLKEEKYGEKHVRLLKRISDDDAWEIEYHQLPRRNTEGEYNVLVQLMTTPVAVCYGAGATPEEARQSAAYNALEYLKIVTNE